MFHQALFPPIRVERCVRYEDRGVNVTAISAAVHSGTHVDAPCHFVPGGESAFDLDLDRVHGPAVCLEVDRRGGEEVTPRDLEAGGPAVERGDIVFIRTGWDVHFHGDHHAYHRKSE